MKLSLTRCLVLVPCLFLGFGGLPAQETETEVSLRAEPVSGEPGEEVALEFWATFLRSPLSAFIVHFRYLPGVPVTFVRTEVEGTASAHAPPRGVVYVPDTSDLVLGPGSLTGAFFGLTRASTPLEAGKDLLLVKAVLRIESSAEPGEYDLSVVHAQFTADEENRSSRGLIVHIEGDAVLTVTAPSGPRPVDGLRCFQDGDEAVLSWSLTEAYDEVTVRRDGLTLSNLGGSETSFRDQPPLGPVSYEVIASRGGGDSRAVVCNMLFQVPRPRPVTGLTCTRSGQTTELRWTNGSSYDTVTVFRNGVFLEELSGSSESYSDLFVSDLYTLYTVKARAGGVGTLPVSCEQNEFYAGGGDPKRDNVMWAEQTRALPGSPGVPVRIFATHPQAVLGFSVSLEVDASELSIRGRRWPEP